MEGNKIPKTAEEWTNLGKSFLNCKNYDETIKACEHALQLDLHFAPAWKLLAKTYNVAGEATDAANILRKATKAIPGDTELWNNLGVVLHDLGELAEAMDAYEKALTHDPKDPVAWYNAGLAFGEINLLGNALYCFKRAGRLGDEDAGENVESLKEKGIQEVAPPFVKEIEKQGIASSDVSTGPVCEMCGAPLPRAPSQGHEVVCLGCGKVWHESDFTKK